MNNASLHNKIERYLLGKCSPEEAANLETEIASDNRLKQQVEIQRISLLGMERLAALDLQQKFSQWDAAFDGPGYTEPGNLSEKSPVVWKWVSAGLLVMLAFTAFLLFQKRIPVPKNPAEKDNPASASALVLRDSLINLNVDYQKLLQQLNDLRAQKPNAEAVQDSVLQIQVRRLGEELIRKDAVIRRLRKGDSQGDSRKMALNAAMPFSKYVENLTTRGSFQGRDATLSAARHALENRRFQEAEHLLRSIHKNSPLQLEVVHLLPYTLFYGEKFDDAIPAFIELKNQDRFEAKEADWHLLLCYIANMQKHGMRAGVLLKEIITDPKHPYFEAAKKLEAKLRVERGL